MRTLVGLLLVVCCLLFLPLCVLLLVLFFWKRREKKDMFWSFFGRTRQEKPNGQPVQGEGREKRREEKPGTLGALAAENGLFTFEKRPQRILATPVPAGQQITVRFADGVVVETDEEAGWWFVVDADTGLLFVLRDADLQARYVRSV